MTAHGSTYKGPRTAGGRIPAYRDPRRGGFVLVVLAVMFAVGFASFHLLPLFTS